MMYKTSVNWFHLLWKRYFFNRIMQIPYFFAPFKALKYIPTVQLPFPNGRWQTMRIKSDALNDANADLWVYRTYYDNMKISRWHRFDVFYSIQRSFLFLYFVHFNPSILAVREVVKQYNIGIREKDTYTHRTPTTFYCCCCCRR